MQRGGEKVIKALLRVDVYHLKLNETIEQE
jgi:hypothetical protein